MAVPILRMAEPGQIPLITDNETVTRVKHRAAVFGGNVERILRQIVFAGDALRRGASDVERGRIIESFLKRVGSQHGELLREALTQTNLQGVIGGVGDSSDFSHRRECARLRNGNGAAGIQTTLIREIHVLRGR